MNDKTYEEVKEEMAKSEYMLELDHIEPQKHNWTDRGAKWTCENAQHPFHEAWKMKKPMTKS
jgi:hypothetical protein